MVANYLGYKPASQPAAPAAVISDDDFSSLANLVPTSEPEQFMTTEEYLALKAASNE